jgi:regulator of RNase E activity RraA
VNVRADCGAAMNWKSDIELFQQMRMHLFTAIIGDVLDQHGLRHQFLKPECRPLNPKMIVCGRAMTVREIDLSDADDPPFGKMLQALDSLQENEV